MEVSDMSCTRKDFIGTGAMAALAGCAGLHGAKTGKFAMNASTLRGYNLSLLDQMKAMALSGFRGYEPWMKDIRAAKADGTLGDVCRIARDSGVSFINGIAFGQWVNPDPKIRAAGLEETKQDMALLAEIGCPCVAASMFGMQKPGSPNLPLEAIAERYVTVLDLGKKMGVRPLLEYWGHSVNLFRLEDALEVVRLTGRDDAAILADVYHTYRGGGSFDAYRKLSAKLLPVLHVNDYPSYPYREQLKDADRVWPGEGRAPWRKILSDLDAASADPWLSLELFNPAYWRTYPGKTLAQGFERLKAVAG
jgi:sugar phosphate isomerase/epimerase